jgi:hypothetical protein
VTLLSEAIELTKWFRVFPLLPDGKPQPNCDACRRTGGNSCPTEAAMQSCDCLTCHSFYRATHMQDAIERMWEAAGADSLIGIATGYGFTVIDFDRHDAHDGVAQFKEWDARGWLPPTVSANTGGGGLHLYYRLPEDVALRNTCPHGTIGVDVKGVGGYVVAPPSAKTGKPAYRWRNSPWHIEMAEIHPELLAAIRFKPERKSETGKDRSKESIMNVFWWMLGSFPSASERGRNNWLFQASCHGGELAAHGVDSHERIEADLIDAGMASGLDETEVRATVISGMSRGIANVEEDDRIDPNA